MLKKVMFFLMAACSATRFLGMSYTLSREAGRFPLAVYIATGVTVAAGLFLVCKRILFKIRMREMELFFALAAVTALFNLLFVKFTERLEATFIDLAVMGTLLDVVFAVVLIVMAEKERKYVKIPVSTQKR